MKHGWSRWWGRRRDPLALGEDLDLRAAFATVAADLHATGTLYAYLAEDQAFMQAAVHGEAPAATSLMGDDHPMIQTLLEGRPRRFVMLDDAQAIQGRFRGTAHLYYPLRRDGRPIGLAVLQRASRGFEEGDMALLQRWQPLILQGLELAIARSQLERLQRENEALLGLVRLAHQCETQPLQYEAVTQIRHLAQASQVVLLERGPHGYGVAASAMACPFATAELRSETRWSAREWPTLLSVLERPPHMLLAPVSELSLTPSESGWLAALGPLHTLLVIGLSETAGQGLLVVGWERPGSLWIRESRLVLSLSELMSLSGIQHQLRVAQRGLEVESARRVERDRHEKRWLGQLGHDLRTTAFALTLIVEAIADHADQPEEVQRGISALDRQLGFLDGFVATRLEAMSGKRSHVLPGPTSLQVALDRALVEAGSPLHYLDLAEDVEVLIAPLNLISLLRAMVEFAGQQGPAQERIRITVSANQAWATVYVADRGPGVPGSSHPTLLPPRFRTAPDPALAPGLVQARQIAEQVGGMLGLQAPESGGTILFVALPTAFWIPAPSAPLGD